MKSFDLERALAGDPVVCTEGSPVTQLTLFKNLNKLVYENESECLVGVYEGTVRTFNKLGINLGCNINLYMVMKSFDLERALAGDPVITRDGRKILDFKYWESISFFECLIENPAPHKNNLTGYNLQGQFFMYGEESPSDLFMAPKTKIYWINIFKHKYTNELNSGSYLYTSSEQANLAAIELNSVWDHIKTISFEIEE